jgi:hypothetical protein
MVSVTGGHFFGGRLWQAIEAISLQQPISAVDWIFVFALPRFVRRIV